VSVHDSFGISCEDSIEIVRRFVGEADSLALKVKALKR
jgi:hypothetical protein